MNNVFSILAQINNLDSGLSNLDETTYSTGVTWMIIAVLVLGILAISFKSPKRSHLDE